MVRYEQAYNDNSEWGGESDCDMASSKVTNEDFAQRVGIHFTMASKLRNGKRTPSTETLVAIREAFGLDANDMVDALKSGKEGFGEYLRDQVFHENDDEPVAV